MQDLDKVTKKVQEVFGDIPVYAVGGCVRDTLLKRKPKDFDYCINLEPDDIEIAVKKAGRRAYLTGKRFGTIGFKVEVDGHWHYIEVTTFRKEVYTKGSRKPEVTFVTELKEDLSRRDFTINAIAYTEDGYFDPFGGRLDLLDKKIKAVGISKDRFREDALRMLRAARFASQLDFDIDPNLIGVIRKMAPSILDISRERWVQEIDKLLISDNPENGLIILMQSYLLKYMIPELYLNFKSPQFFQETIAEIIKQPKDADIRWAALLYGIGKIFVANFELYMDDMASLPHGHEKIGKEISKGISTRLKFSNQRQQIINEYSGSIS